MVDQELKNSSEAHTCAGGNQPTGLSHIRVSLPLTLLLPLPFHSLQKSVENISSLLRGGLKEINLRVCKEKAEYTSTAMVSPKENASSHKLASAAYLHGVFGG